MGKVEPPEPTDKEDGGNTDKRDTIISAVDRYCPTSSTILNRNRDNCKRVDKPAVWNGTCAVPMTLAPKFNPVGPSKQHCWHESTDTISDGLSVSGTSELVIPSTSGIMARTMVNHLLTERCRTQTKTEVKTRLTFNYLHSCSSWNLHPASQDCGSQ